MSVEHLNEVLDRSKELGFLGPGPVSDHIAHAVGFVDHLPPLPHRLLDLGSGGGLPGLVVLSRRPDVEGTLLDASARRCEFLEWAVARLGIRADIVCQPAEEAGRPRNGRREAFECVVARSFASPAMTAEFAAGFLAVGGLLLVSEPPPDASLDQRWVAEGLRRVGLSSPRRSPRSSIALAVMTKVATTDEMYPRRLPRVRRDPLWGEAG